MGSGKFPSLWGKPLRGIPAPQTLKWVSRGFGVWGSPHYFGVLAARGSPGTAALEVGPTVPNSVTPFGGGSVMGDGDKLAPARGICASGTVCGGRHMALVIPCVPDITGHVSQPGVVSRCCRPCPVSGVTTTVTSVGATRVSPPCCSPLWGSSHGSSVPQWGCVPPAGGAALGAPQYPGGLHHGGLRRGAVPGAVGREGARLRLWHGARNGRSNSCDLLISPLQRVPSPHSSCRQFRGALPVSPAGTHPDKPGCPRPTWGRGPWPPVGAAPDSGWAAHVRRSGISTDPGCIRGASLEIPPRLGLHFPLGGFPPSARAGGG